LEDVASIEEEGLHHLGSVSSCLKVKKEGVYPVWQIHLSFLGYELQDTAVCSSLDFAAVDELE